VTRRSRDELPSKHSGRSMNEGTKNAVCSTVRHFSDNGVVNFLRYQTGSRLPPQRSKSAIVTSSTGSLCLVVCMSHICSFRILATTFSILSPSSPSNAGATSTSRQYRRVLLVGQVWPSAPYRRIGNGLIISMSCLDIATTSKGLLNSCNKKSAYALVISKGHVSAR
jgi:hypothetical protein